MTDVVDKLWGFCHTLGHDGIDYGDYIEQLTYLLFLKMADERGVQTDYLARNAGRLGERLVDVGLATTAAPTYLKAHSSTFSANLVDGGLAANNPSMVALVDALQFERKSKRGTPGGHLKLLHLWPGQIPPPWPGRDERL